MGEGGLIVGRKKERSDLEEMYSSGQSEFVAVYGRRRVGKTFLVNETFSGRFAFSHSGLSPVESSRDHGETDSRMTNQLMHIHRSLVAQGSEAPAPKNWLEAFYQLEDLLASKSDGSKMVVFLDEVQWMDTPRSMFMTGLEAFWNGWACLRHDILLIVCGSSTSWVMNRLVHNHGGMYGRLTRRIRLMPFDLSECEEYLSSIGMPLSRYDTALAYMVFGGIPYYLRYLDRSLSMSQNIEALLLSTDGLLAGEFEDLFSSTFSNPGPMKSIVKALHSRHRGLTRQEIVSASGIPDSGYLSLMLESLRESGFITRYVPFGEGKRGMLFRLTDPFCIFYLDFVDPETRRDSYKAAADPESGTAASWRGLSFEVLCFNHIPQIKDALGIGGVRTEVSLWSKRGDAGSQGTQADLIIERADNVVDVCEAKFLKREFAIDKSYDEALRRRKSLVEDVIADKVVTVRNVLITTVGLKQNEYRWDFSAVVTLDDLFQSRI